MITEFFFESRSANYALRQHGAQEDDPIISVELALISAPAMYDSTSLLINKAAWRMTISAVNRIEPPARPSGWITYYVAEGRQGCLIEIIQSKERF